MHFCSNTTSTNTSYSLSSLQAMENMAGQKYTDTAPYHQTGILLPSEYWHDSKQNSKRKLLYRWL